MNKEQVNELVISQWIKIKKRKEGVKEIGKEDLRGKQR